MASQAQSEKVNILIGLSGPSSSGKTTLARLLRSIFNTSANTKSNSERDKGPASSSNKDRRIWLTILHEDDFYKTDTEIPSRELSSAEFGTRTLQDWDCIGSIDLELLRQTLECIKREGRLPEGSFSKEDLNEVGESGVGDDVVGRYAEEVRRAVSAKGEGEGGADVYVWLLDGFLLYPSPEESAESLAGQLREILGPLLDTRLFLPSTRERTIARRARRAGYVTLEGFWADPPGYVEDCVWPNYARDHAWLFGGEDALGNVDEGWVDREVAKKEGIEVGPGSGEVHMSEILEWGVGRVREVIERVGWKGVS